jgi:hypothetical protein
MYREARRLEYPPLWVWGMIVGAIIAGKFIYRWQTTKQFAKEAEESKSRSDDKTKVISKDSYDKIKKSSIRSVRSHKYSPKYYYKDFFAIKKQKKEHKD